MKSRPKITKKHLQVYALWEKAASQPRKPGSFSLVNMSDVAWAAGIDRETAFKLYDEYVAHLRDKDAIRAELIMSMPARELRAMFPALGTRSGMSPPMMDAFLRDFGVTHEAMAQELKDEASDYKKGFVPSLPSDYSHW